MLSAGLRLLGPVIGLAFVWGLFAAINGWSFIRLSNQQLMLMQTAVVGTAAIGATVVIISGSIDLSVGSMIAMVAVAVALLGNAGLPAGVAALGGITTGALAGLLIGALVIGLGGRLMALVTAGKAPKSLPISSFIVTLGMMSTFRGAAKGLADNQSVYFQGTWLDSLLGQGAGLLVDPGVWLMLVLAGLVAAMLRFTRFGRHVFAVGSNEQTARLCGLRVFILAGMCTAAAAILQFSNLTGTASPTAAGGYELKVIAACVIGGASLAGGEGSVIGSLVGALIMTVVANGCTKAGLDNWVQEVVTGVIIIIAVMLDQLRHHRGS